MPWKDPVKDDTLVLDITDKGLERVDRVRTRSPQSNLDFRVLTRISYEPLSIGELVREFGSEVRDSLRALIRSGYLEVGGGYY